MAAPLSPPPALLSLHTGKAVLCHSDLPALRPAAADPDGGRRTL
jgi:hypothetical protein